MFCTAEVSVAEVMEYAKHMTKEMAGKDVEHILEEIDTDKDGKLSLSLHMQNEWYRVKQLRVN